VFLFCGFFKKISLNSCKKFIKKTYNHIFAGKGRTKIVITLKRLYENNILSDCRAVIPTKTGILPEFQGFNIHIH